MTNLNSNSAGSDGIANKGYLVIYKLILKSLKASSGRLATSTCQCFSSLANQIYVYTCK